MFQSSEKLFIAAFEFKQSPCEPFHFFLPLKLPKSSHPHPCFTYQESSTSFQSHAPGEGSNEALHFAILQESLIVMLFLAALLQHGIHL